MTESPRNWTFTPLGNACEILDFKRVPINSKERKARISGKPDNQLFPYYGRLVKSMSSMATCSKENMSYSERTAHHFLIRSGTRHTS